MKSEHCGFCNFGRDLRLGHEEEECQHCDGTGLQPQRSRPDWLPSWVQIAEPYEPHALSAD